MKKKAAKKTKGKVLRTIYEKLYYIQQNVGSVLKLGGLGDEHEYTFSYEKDVIAEVKPLLAKVGVLILQTVAGSSMLDNGIVKVSVRYKLINVSNPKDFYEVYFDGLGQDMEGTMPGDKGLAKAITMANKYFLAKTFQMPIGGDAESEKRAKAKKDGKGEAMKREEDPKAAYDSACKAISSTRNIDGLNQYAEEVEKNKLFNAKQKLDLKKRITDRIDELQK